MKISITASGSICFSVHPWKFNFYGCQSFSYPFGRIFINCEPQFKIDAYEYEILEFERKFTMFKKVKDVLPGDKFWFRSELYTASSTHYIDLTTVKIYTDKGRLFLEEDQLLFLN